ncbi:MAG: 23S rRNA (adenine(2503)-C(2))-methyltransferase RlmN [Candidatus Omnitrophica bacterium]|nr:23S rRNA (adenine(2503)-C(2))-methyltransferase RlmN [Candidatus Omnitrophota bacterium]
MNKASIKDLSKKELEEAIKEAGGQSYRAGQIFRWLYKIAVGAFDEMKDIPAPLREALDARFRIISLETIDTRRSLSDGTTKYLFRLEDGNTVEAVLLPERTRATVCISSQAGCKFKCDFCASASAPFARNLTSGEIAGEVMAIKAANPGANITNIVFMGIGEPFDNYENVLKAARLFNDKDAFNIGSRRMTISTCGVVPGIERLAKEGMQIELSVSLHSAGDAVRSKLMPVNKRYPLRELMASCKDYIRSTGRIITFEYVLLDGVNISRESAAELAGLLKGVKCKVNAISYNKVPGSKYGAPKDKDVKVFMQTLADAGVNVIHRKPKGEDIDAGCGQLRASRLK